MLLRDIFKKIKRPFLQNRNGVKPHVLFDTLPVRTGDVILVEEPFRHIVVDDFFTNEAYQDLCRVFNAQLKKGLSETRSRDLFMRSPSGYDAYLFTPDPRGDYPLSVFNSLPWIFSFSSLFDISPSMETKLEFHCHSPGSDDGWAHNDYNLCSFREEKLSNGVNPWYHQCVYTDDVHGKQSGTLKRMRSVAILYFLNNSWKDGDGGEVGLYVNKQVVKKVAPINNRLLAFEISPTSFHGFLKNHAHERNSIIQWLHQDPQMMFKKFNVYEPTRWPR